MNLPDKIYKAGVVGAGGGAFPTHVKAKSKVEFVIANGAECEPLIHKDFEIMLNFPDEIIEGMILMMEQTGAKKGIFGIKAKNIKAIEAIEKAIEERNANIEMCVLGDFYPSGDEYELVYEATKRLIPPHGIPLDIGCVVNNVETFYNISKANKDEPVLRKFLCVSGIVKNPSSFFVEIGTSFKELIKLAGGTTTNDFGIFVSGLLMGKLTFDLDEVVTKATAGIIVLPRDHYLIDRMNRSYDDMNRIGKSACDQCSYCTEFCPRYLLGYDVQPHKVMRTLEFSTSGKEYWNQFADLCCSCGLCSLYACPEDLYPREACDQSKVQMKKEGVRYEQQKPVKVHPIKEGRRVPLKQLMKRINVEQYESKTPFTEIDFEPQLVRIKLKQHAGAPSIPEVKVNELIIKGQIIAAPDEGNLGANIHSPISGKVMEITDDYIEIKR